jgi:hypothetical protein
MYAETAFSGCRWPQSALLRKSGEGRFEIAIGSGVRNNELQAKRTAAACRSATADWAAGPAGSTRMPKGAAWLSDRGAIAFVSALARSLSRRCRRGSRRAG